MLLVRIVKVIIPILPMKVKIFIMKKLFYKLGKNSKVYTNNIGTEPYLIKIGDFVNVAAGVKFINHDISCENISRLTSGMKLDSVGSIELKNNSFVGAYSILMPNTSVGENSVIAAGSVLTKNVPDNEVWGGVPAKKIMSIEEYKNKLIEKNIKYNWSGKKGLNLIRSRQIYFFREDFASNELH